MKTALCTLALACAISALSFASYAQSGTTAAPAQVQAPTGAMNNGAPTSNAGQRHGPCRDDVQKFCGNVQKGGGAILACLKQHESELSPRCEAGMKRHENKQQGSAGQAAPTQTAIAPASAPPVPAPAGNAPVK